MRAISASPLALWCVASRYDGGCCRHYTSAHWPAPLCTLAYWY